MDDDAIKIVGGLIALVIIFGISGCVSAISWQNEAATFNKFKRPDQPAATIWDAAFADLRVTN